MLLLAFASALQEGDRSSDRSPFFMRNPLPERALNVGHLSPSGERSRSQPRVRGLGNSVSNLRVTK